MIKRELKNVLKEFLSSGGNSPITEATLTKDQLSKREEIIKNLKKNKRELVKRYGKDAEAVMYGRATNLAKKATSEMNKEKLKELVRKSLMNEGKEPTEEDIKDIMAIFKIDKEKAIKLYHEHYQDYQSEMGEGKKSDVDGDGDIDSQDYLLKRDAAIKKAKGEMKEDIDLGHEDNEPHMIKGQLYQIGKYAMDLYAIMEELEEKGGEYDLPAWWQEKITTAKNMMSGAKHYLEFELKEPAIDAAVDAITGEEPHEGEPMMEEEIGKADILSSELYKLKGKIQDAFFDKIRKFINMGSYEDAEYLLNRVKGQMKEKSLAETIAKKLKETLYNPGEIHGEYEIGDVVLYNGEDHEITGVEGDRIYIRPEAPSTILGKKSSFWITKNDLGVKEGYGEFDMEDDGPDYNSISDLEDELRRLIRWSNQYGSKGADAKINQLEKRIEDLKAQKLKLKND